MSAVRRLAVSALIFFACQPSVAAADAPPVRVPESRRDTHSSESSAFAFARVVDSAAALARQAFVPRTSSLPKALAAVDYDAYRDIRFRPDRSLFRAEHLPFEVQFFHPGFLFPYSVDVFVVEDGRPLPVSFSRALFDYGRNRGVRESVPASLGFAGFRVHYPINRPNYRDEIAVFLGASYFRLLGRGQVYGGSARALAIDTGGDREEFPFFRTFWIERPSRSARTFVVYALLDSRSVTGAYRFSITPGDPTIADVDATLFSRTPVRTLGIAPLTSMFFFGEATPAKFEDFRPEVHDSDGLLLHNGSGEWIWRPLRNPDAVSVSAFSLNHPRGFGLMQRDRDFEHYQDLEAHYERRPSYWIEPHGDWGEGHVELVELPVTRENDDNVAAYWVPSAPVTAPNQRRDFSYRIEAALDRGSEAPAGHAVATRTTPAVRHAAQKERVWNARRFIVDFESRYLQELGATEPVAADVTAANGNATLGSVTVTKNPVNGTWRLEFNVQAASPKPVELRAFLRKDDDVLTETWSYRWDPRVNMPQPAAP